MIRKLALGLAVVILQAGMVIGLTASPTGATVAHRSAAQPHVVGGVSVNPAKATETTQGNVSVAIVGKGLIPNTKYKIIAATLTVNCKNTVNNKTVTTDLKGVFNYSAKAGPNCVAEKFTIQVQKLASPFTVYTASFQILAP
jgi:hypothetical protein